MYLLFLNIAIDVSKIIAYIIEESLAAVLQYFSGYIGMVQFFIIIELSFDLNEKCGDLYVISLIYVLIFYVAIGFVCIFISALVFYMKIKNKEIIF